MVRNSRNHPDDTDFFGHRDFLYFCHRRRPEQSRRSTPRSQRYSPRKSTEVFDTDLRRLTLFFICHRAAERAQRCSQLRVLGEHSSQSELFQNATPSTTRAYRPSIKLTACSTPLRWIAEADFLVHCSEFVVYCYNSKLRT